MKSLNNKALACMVVLVIVLAQGCTDDFAKRAYNTLETAQIAYDTAMKIAASAHDKGEITDDQRESIEAAGRIYYTSWMAASSALKAYVKSGNSDHDAQSIVMAAMSEMLFNFDKYKAVVTEIIKAVNMPEVKR